MTACNLRSLLVAAIVLSNCITWTASRRHYTQHMHRTRHRRQGAGLYLSGSYVIPGGEGAGWGEWGEVSPCSRTCGGGVASQKRICLQVGPDGRPQCRGGDTKYFSCQTQDCPPDAVDFRAEQCAAYDDKDFRGFKYKWIPYTKTPNPCELNCMPRGERFYYRHSAKVIDGTRCNEDSFDVCVDGVCQPVGCDMMLGSNAREDKCRECRGNGVNCHTAGGLIDTQDLIKGYNDILLIPASATTIVIEEIAPSNNYLALRGKNGTFYLNGLYHIDFPRSLMIAGALWNYERSQSGFAAPDKLKCLGPTLEPLYLSLLLQDENVGIQYEYSVPTKLAPVTDRRYNWVHEEFTPCSASCGGGFQTRNVTCRSSEELEVVDEALCDEGLKPPSNQSCNDEACPPEWVEEPWSECSKRCGKDGVRKREVTCQKIISNGYPSLVADKECFDLHGPKPELFQECNRDAVCPQWFIGRWQACNKLCDEGTQKRQVICYQKTNGRIEVLDDKECEDEKPATEQPCMLSVCAGLDWITTEWSGCDTCLSTVQTRQIVCASVDHQVYNDSLCSYHNRPPTEQPCDKLKLPPCEVQWYSTQWSKCSVECGDGVQVRKVFCGVYEDGTVREVADELCAAYPKYNDTKPCSVPLDKCPYQWYAGPWQGCDAACDGGEEYRHVMCIRGNKPAYDCQLMTVPDTSRTCNLHPCNPDELITVTVPIVDDVEDDDDLPFCDDEEDYPEVGLDLSTLYDTMSSDAGYNGTYETESSFLGLSTDEGSGSGMGSTETDDGETGLTTLSIIDSTDSSFSVDFDYTDKFTTDATDYDTTDNSTTDISTSETGSTEKDLNETDATETANTSETDSSTLASVTSSEDTEATNDYSTTDKTDATESTGSSETAETDINASTETSVASSDETTTSATISDISTTDSASTDTTEKVSTIKDKFVTTRRPPEVEETSTQSTVTDESASTSTDESGSTETSVSGAETENTASTVSETDSTATESTETEDTTGTGGTEDSTSTGETEDTTGTGETEDTTGTGETEDTTGTGETEDTTGTDETVDTDSTEETPGSDSTSESVTPTTDLTSTDSSSESSSESTITSESSSTDITEESSSDLSAMSTEPSSTGTTEESSSGSTTISTESSSTGTTEESSSEATTISAEPSSTGSTEVSSSESSTPSAELSSTVTTEATTDTEATKSTDTKTTSSTDTNTTVSTFTTEDDDSTTTFVTISKSKNSTTTLPPDVTTRRATEGTSVGSSETTTEPSVTTESSASTIGSSDSTVATSPASDSESTTTAETASGSESTTESGSTTTISGSESSTTEGSASSTSESGITTGSESSGTAESTLAESTTTEIVSSTEPATTVSGGSTESELTTTKASESTEETTSGSTTEIIQSTTTGESEASGVTTEGLSTTELSATETTTPSLGKSSRIPFTTPPRVCKPRRKHKCEKTRFGCCPDRKTEAKDPFDKGCRKPRTCVETDFGCCPDGVSPAHGRHGEGCPVTPCEETLFGCCLSDNKTAAQGNDQDGCPPPLPACALSTHGCCADNETEATGPNSEGCPESSTTTSMAAETTTAATESTETTETHETTSTIKGSSTSETSSIEDSSVTAIATLMEECADSEFGCCYDNETSASGPDGQGCPCNATEFGCCSDGVSPAHQLNQKGCQGLCKDSAHGCCPDNETPAHGPEFEGCCLLTAFGCCPDNRKPAEGPHLEGCGCQSSQHGCCPDNVTAALGPNNEGCGCQYTAFGCCPDRRTTASGPDYEGCGCHTYQFGCCPDGVTISIGPDQQGCHCRYSTYGCCGDEQTPATGPNGAGCDCAASKHGCCPDGQTPAEGTKFLGCTDVIEDKQAVCALPTDPGPCHNFTAMWFYDLTYGGCSRFWYGGCEGNGNKFATKEDCEDICVQPAPKDACKLPGVKGPCDADLVHWYYNNTVEQCIPFRYGGCLGNANNFDSRELCQTQCEPDKSSDKCNLPIEKGPCAGNFSSWGYNIESRKCEQFIWGGCEGNGNRFKTESACQMRCNPTPTECTEPQEAGNCSNKEALWSFSQTENRCVPFYYTGCGGNTNRFYDRESCEQFCPSAYEPDKCTLPAETGECSSYREKWFYDTAIKRCRQFYYGGCGGNENNFDTEAQCQNACSESTTTTTTVRPTQPQQPEAQPQPQPQPEAEPNAFCFFEIDQGGRCASASPEQRYGYDSSLGKCVTFQYLGCGGNQNNFPYEEYCKYYCHPVQDICQLPMLAGPCDESVMAWFYDPASDSCSQFTYGGCEGNDNRFESREACETRCRTGVTNDVTTRRTPLAVHTPIIENRFGEVLPPNCTVSPTLEECTSAGEVWFFDVQQHECVSHMNPGSGTECRHTATFLTQEGCERNCGAFRGVDVCKQRVDPGPCREFVAKVYFDQDSGSCKQFAYGGCLGGANRFSNVEECAQTCLSSIDVCQLPVEQGNCYLNIRQWYYDASRGYCNQFVYTGCGGNDNRFETRQECEARCRRPAAPITTTTLASVVKPEPASACSTPSSLAPCGSNLTVFYYDAASKSCVPSEFGNCGHPNSYRSEEECERQCGAFVGLDVCQARLDTGPCRNPVPKYFYDSATGSCQGFAYSGCGGGPNRFSTIAECEELCGNSGPAPGCLLEVDTGYAEGCLEPSVPRYHYSTSRADCMLFVYKGCGGNENNFPTYKQCQRICIPSANNEVGCETYESECATLHCEYGVERTPAPGGCERCACADASTQCDLLRQECDALVCPYGVNRIQQDGCERCVCQEDPCSVANCSPDQRCVATAYTDPITHEPKYSASCITDHVDQGNEVLPDCSYEETACAQLRCEFGVQHVRTADGCQRCQCVAVEIDCEPLRKDCEQLSCEYGLNRTKGPDGCERCTCKDPCLGKSCPDGERCVVNAYRDIMDEMQYSSECRAVTKEGQCPLDETTSNEVMCRHECNDDADCRGIGKCCRRGCSDLCLVPATPGPPMHNIHTTTYAPDIPAAPQALPQSEPEVTASEGGKATLRCLFHSNPPPRITWRFGEVTIDGNVGRYRLMSDGALEIVSLYRNDTGVYICVADNELGRATQEINLVVNDPVRTPVGIAGDENAVVTGELNRPLSISCLAFGHPAPGIYWEHNGAMVAFNDAIYEIRGNTLLIRSLSVDTLGQYTCQAYNGVGKAASWVVSVRAYRPEGIFLEHEYVVPRHYIRTTPRSPPPSTREVTTTTSTTTTTTERPIFFTVPVSTHVSTAYSTMRTGAELRLVCEVDGYPEPDVYWTKDSARITPNERISISGSAVVSRLVISKVAVSDSGLYGCHADNRYTSHSDNAQINVQQLTVPAKCTDNPFFANCDLIVRSKFCTHKYYSKFCCKSCVEAGQLDPQVAEMQADQPYRKK